MCPGWCVSKHALCLQGQKFPLLVTMAMCVCVTDFLDLTHTLALPPFAGRNAIPATTLASVP